ncbi:hypothetical protein F0562_027512 [Nyssa sinensis]|uniref:Alginate lyase 2 domain-containing protein n=1 Tax=Nyssa sinensis TaxID=561372 RepID=A0A5J5B5H0_9ASTE|nr:hypothetical protein F0562_027512 [Nyssa sinensis]
MIMRNLINFFCNYVLLLVVLLESLNNYNFYLLVGADPTDGFANVALTEWNFEIQKPYDIPVEERYSFENGVHRLWVYADDKPHEPNSHTQPRTEIRIRGLDYSSGVWQFEGDAFVPNGTSGATIAQIHGAAKGATTILLRIFNGDMRYYSHDLGLDYSSGVWQFEGHDFVPNGTSGAIIVQIHGAAKSATTLILRIFNGDLRYYLRDLVAIHLYDKWFRVNVIHDVDGGMVTVFINGVQKFVTKDRGPGDLNFKC